MSKPLAVPHYRQLRDGYCLPACAQMVLAYWGIERKQQVLAQQLQTMPDVGTPASRIRLLSSNVMQVTYQAGSLIDLRDALAQKVPPNSVGVHVGTPLLANCHRARCCLIGAYR